MRQQDPGRSTEPIGRCQWRCGVVDARPCLSGMANPRPGVKRWDGDQVATLAMCLSMAQEAAGCRSTATTSAYVAANPADLSSLRLG